MDFVDWIMYVSGGAFGLLTLGLALSRASAFTERDINPIWWIAFIVFGGLLAVTLIADLVVPVDTIIYLTNGSNDAREVLIDSRAICMPPKSYDRFQWRLGRPDKVTVVGANGDRGGVYKVDKGTWLINASSVSVYADMYAEGGNAIDYDALAAPQRSAVHVDGRYGKPFRMFSQSQFDRVYSAGGDIVEGSRSGPCSNDDRKKKKKPDEAKPN